MGNLNAEEVKKWLEICAEDTPYPNQSQALLDALALIKELTKENERLNKQNEELQEVANTAVGSFIRLETHYKFECKRADTIKANTVRDFAERLKAEAYVPKPYGVSKVVDVGAIDRIEKEILNKTEEEKK